MTNSEYDAIVIGAGSVGVPITHFLAQDGLKVLCVDKRASSGQGQNKSAIGGVRATHSDPAKILTCQESLRIFSTWKDTTGTDIGWKMGGYCFPVYEEKDETMLRSLLSIQKQYTLDIDWCGPEEVAKAVMGIEKRGLRGGTLSPQDGQVSPLLAIESFTNEAMANGAEFKFNEAVQSLMLEGDDQAIAGVVTDKGQYRVPIVVNAAGARASEICKMADLDLQVTPDSHEAGITSPVKQFLDPLVVDIRPGPEGKTKNFYFGQVESGQVIFCYTTLDPIYGENRDCTSEFMPTIARRLVSLIPRLKGLSVRRLWRGLYPMTPDGVPIVGKAPNVRGLYLAIGMCGQGFMLGPGIGTNVANLITKGKPLMDPEVFEMYSPERDFTKGVTESLK